MKNILKILMIIAVAMIGFAFIGCEGPMGPDGQIGEEGDEWIPELVVDINIHEDNELVIVLGRPTTIVVSAVPDNATFQTMLWEIYDEHSIDVINFNGLSMATGNSVTVTGLMDGEARILVTAMGSGSEVVDAIITVNVEGVATQIARLPEQIAELAPNAPVNLTLYVHGDERLAPQVLDFSEQFPGRPIMLTLTRGTPGGDLTLSEPGAMFTIGEDVALVLEDIVLRGIPRNTGGALVAVTEGVLVMEAGSKITGNNNPIDNPQGTIWASANIQGGGVRVEENGFFIMHDGSISGNHVTGSNLTGTAAFGGGGVAVNGIFIMEGGKIYDNFAPHGGGVVVLANGDFTMDFDAEISNNIARSWGGGVNTEVGSTFLMRNGTISGNSSTNGGGVYNRSDFEMLNGTISRNESRTVGGGGVTNQHSFTMRGGTISNNIAASTGGGVSSTPVASVFYMENGVISNNTAEMHGGGLIIGGAFTMRNGTISGNQSGDLGGAIHLMQFASASATMHNGQIFGNRAEGDGGAINMWANSSFVMHDGRIFNNTSAGGHGGAVSMSGNSNSFTMHYGEFSGNTATLGNGGAISIAGNSASFTMLNGTISGNTAGGSGGAVNIVGANNVANAGSFTMQNGKISGNTAGVNGGGINAAAVTLTTSFARITMHNGEISDNKASMVSGTGGGVSSGNNSRFFMFGGTISGNSAWSGGGVYNSGLGQNGPFTMSGGTISGNNAVFGGGIHNEPAQPGGVTAGAATLANPATVLISGGIIHGSDASSELRNTVTGQDAQGAAILTSTGFTRSWVHDLNADHNNLPAGNASSTMSLVTQNVTVDVLAAEIVSVNIEDIPDTHDTMNILVSASGGNQVNLGTWPTSVSGSFAFLFPVTPGSWNIQINFYDGTDFMSSHVVTTNLIRGNNNINFSEFD